MSMNGYLCDKGVQYYTVAAEDWLGLYRVLAEYCDPQPSSSFLMSSWRLHLRTHLQ
jgi:hypothetical protein